MRFAESTNNPLIGEPSLIRSQKRKLLQYLFKTLNVRKNSRMEAR
jgi:hypothetical protein